MGFLENWYPRERSKDIHASLAHLIKASISLLRHLREQRAYWFVAYRSGTNADDSNMFDAEIMTDVDADGTEQEYGAAEGDEPNRYSVPQKHVRLKIFPGLFKRGNADGLRYDIEECYVKTRVKVS